MIIVFPSIILAQPQLPLPPKSISDSIISYTKDFRLHKTGAPGVLVRVYYPNLWDLSFADGINNIETGEIAKPDLTYRIASISKIFCATAILNLTEQGLIKLDDPINRWFSSNYLQNIRDGNRITIRDLLQHSSGLGEPQSEINFITTPYTDYSDSILTIIANSPQRSFGYGYYFYSNANYNLLAEIIKKVTGVEYNQYIEQNIIKPFNLRHTFPDSLPLSTSFKGYIPCSAIPNCRFKIDTLLDYSQANVSWAKGAADITSNNQDLINFYYFLQQGEILPENLVDSMTLGHFTKYGFGTMIFERNGEKFAIGHMGNGAGYSNILCKLISNNVYVSFSFNRNQLGLSLLENYLLGLASIIDHYETLNSLIIN